MKIYVNQAELRRAEVKRQNKDNRDVAIFASLLLIIMAITLVSALHAV